MTETTKRPDGSQTVVETKKDGTVSTTDTRKDGVKTDTVTTTEGNTTATVTAPKDVQKVTMTIPTPKKPKPGEVAVIISADGTKTVGKNSVATEDGMTITLTVSATLELVDNSKTFSDVVGGEWYADAVQFAASRELLQGNGTGFAPPGAHGPRYAHDSALPL